MERIGERQSVGCCLCALLLRSTESNYNRLPDRAYLQIVKYIGLLRIIIDNLVDLCSKEVTKLPLCYGVPINSLDFLTDDTSPLRSDRSRSVISVDPGIQSRQKIQTMIRASVRSCEQINERDEAGLNCAMKPFDNICVMPIALWRFSILHDHILRG